MNNFIFHQPTKIIFGCGSINCIPDVVKPFGKKALVVTGRNSAQKSGLLDIIIRHLANEGIDFIIFDRVEPNPKIETILAGREMALAFSPDFIIGAGGGSAIDAAKAISAAFTSDNPAGNLEDLFGRDKIGGNPIPVIAIPTTAGTGSEVTRHSIITDYSKGTKENISSVKLIPKIAILDPSLTISMPLELTIYSGVDALSHAIEGIISKKSQPITDLLAKEAIALISEYLPRLIKNLTDTETRGKMLYASCLAGIVISHTGTTLTHKMGYGYTLMYGFPHGLANGLLLPRTIEFNQDAVPDKIGGIIHLFDNSFNNPNPNMQHCKGIGNKGIGNILRDFLKRIGFPQNVKVIGGKEEDIGILTKQVMENKNKLGDNPRDVGKPDVEKIFKEALISV